MAITLGAGWAGDGPTRLRLFSVVPVRVGIGSVFAVVCRFVGNCHSLV